MDPSKLSHPNPLQLAAFASGQASQEVATEIGLHLADCETCRTVIDQLPEDTLLSLLRKPSEPVVPRPEASPAVPPGPDAGVPAATILPELADHARYHVLELLGSGGMGAVYKAEHRLMERLVALKVINPSLINRPNMVERFRREVKAAARLTHPNIVTAHDADQAGNTHFLVMEFVEGISLAQRVQQQGPLPVGQACDFIRQAALGLQFACDHGMVHRDIKPHNLMLTPQGNVKILDFGLARFVLERAPAGAERDPDTAEASGASPGRPAGALTETGVLMGTADFIAPEQTTDPAQADIRADVYSLGCTLYYLLAGHGPFPDGTALDKLTAHCERMPPPLTKVREVPPELTKVVERMMAKDPAQRYQTPAEAAEALLPFIRKATPPRRLGYLVAAAALFASVLAGALIYVQTDKGEFVIEAQDEKLALLVNQKGVKIHDRAANRHYELTVGRHDIRRGTYELDVQEVPEGVAFSVQTFTLKRGGRETLRVSFKPKEDKDYLRASALRWFPAEATFFAARDMRVFPELSVQQILVLSQLVEGVDPRERDRIWKFVSMIGRIDRIAVAYVADRQRPSKSRIFIRVTGAIGHQRLAAWFRNEWPGAMVVEEKGPHGEPLTLVSSGSQPIAPCFALVGNTDLILAGYQGHAEKHLEVVRQALDLRAGRGASLPGPHARALEDVPDDTWLLLRGEPPHILENFFLFPVLPRQIMVTVCGKTSVEGRFQAAFSTAADAQAFVANLNQLKQVAAAFVMNPPVRIDPQAAELLVGTLNGVRIEVHEERVNVVVHVSTEAVTAVTETIRELPLPLFKALLSPRPRHPDKDKSNKR